MQSIKQNKTQQNKMQSIKHNNKHATIHTSITKCNSNKHNNWCVVTIDVADNKTKYNNNRDNNNKKKHNDNKHNNKKNTSTTNTM